MADLLLIDLSALFWPTYHATNPSEPAGTVEDRVLVRARQAAADFEHVVVCCDGKGYKRQQMYPEYKAHRAEKPEETFEMLRTIKRQLTEDGYVLAECDGYEADDTIATLVGQAEGNVVVYTGDKDLAQLCAEEHVTIWSIRSGDQMGAEGVKEKFGVGPHQLGDWLALVGDASDNIPGLPGVGAKTATKLLQAHGSIDGIYQAIDGLTPKLKESLVEYAEQLTLARKLVELMDDAPVVLADLLAEDKRNDGPAYDAEGEEDDSMATEQEDTTVANEEQAPQSDRVVQEKAAAMVPAGQSYEMTAPRPAAAERWESNLEPNDLRGAMFLAKTLAQSSVVKTRDPATVLAMIMMGRALGFGAMQTVQNCHIIDSKLTLSSSAIVGLILSSGKADFFKCVESTPTKATWKTHRKDDPDPEPTMVTFTIEDAERAGLAGKGIWQKYGTQMLMWRAALQLARMCYSDLVSGMYSPEELGGDRAEHVEAA